MKGKQSKYLESEKKIIEMITSERMWNCWMKSIFFFLHKSGWKFVKCAVNLVLIQTYSIFLFILIHKSVIV